MNFMVNKVLDDQINGGEDKQVEYEEEEASSSQDNSNSFVITFEVVRDGEV